MASCSFLSLLLLLVAAATAASTSAAGGRIRLFNGSRLEMFVDELPDMPRLQGYAVEDGKPVAGNLTIGMYEKLWKFHRDLPPTRVFAYGASKTAATVPGPTIEALRGVPTYITWTNHLPLRHILPWDPTLVQPAAGLGHATAGVKTVVHLHGGVHPPASDGNSNAWFTAGFAAVGPAFAGPTSFYPNAQPPGNLWYHDHAMGLTRVNLLAGLFGAYALRSPDLEEPLCLPSAPHFDRHLVLFDRSFSADGSLYMNATGDNPSVHPQWQPEYFGDVIVVNGKAWPYLPVRRRRYRFRILNASNARFFRLFFKDDRRLVFHHVGSDSTYLPRPVTSRKFLLAPSEIADVVVDFADTAADMALLVSDAPYPYPGDAGDTVEEMKVIKFVIGRAEPDASRVPRRLLRLPPPAPHRAEARRYITMYEYESDTTGEPLRLLLNAKPYEAPATETPREGSLEIWEIINLTDDNHPLHVHLGVFRALEQRELTDLEAFKACMERSNNAEVCHVAERARRGRRYAVPPHEKGWKNVFKMMPGVVTRILVRFRPLDHGSYGFNVTAEPGYVYHCHILDHEDNSMMRPLKLLPSKL